MLNYKPISSTSPFFQLTNIQPSSSTILLASLLGLAVFLSIIPSQLTAEAQQTSQNLIQLPVGEVVYKIEVREEGIYEISAADLINEGMNSGVNPAEIQVVHNGQQVAWELVADGASQSNVFDGNDKIRFYGWPFDESRDEKLFVNNNVYWIIPGRTAKQVQTSGSFGETLPAITSVPATIQLEFDDHFDSMHMLEVDWEREDAEPDHYFWTTISRPFGTDVITKVIEIDLPHPTDTVSLANIEAIGAARANGNTPGTAAMALPDGGAVEHDFYLGDIFSLSKTIPNNELADGLNPILFTHSISSTNDSAGSFFINYFNVSYAQDLKGSDDFLSFSYDGSGGTTFEVSNFLATSASQMIVWEITDRYTPRAYNASTAASNSFRFNSSLSGESDFAVASPLGVRGVEPSSISPYFVNNIAPANGYADWVAISYGDFIDIPGTDEDVQGLATHRASYSHLETHVVDIEDVINQHGYGFASSASVKDYIDHAYSDWSTPVRYVLLVGDGHYNPRHLACSTCAVGNANFHTSADSLIPIYPSFTDEYQGLIPSDFRYSLLEGDDLIPEISIGRLTSENVEHVKDSVSKIIAYENNLITNPSWTSNMHFAHDWPDRVPDDFFRVRSEIARDTALAHGFTPSVSGLNAKPSGVDDPNAVDWRQSISQAASEGISLLIYRGHGSISGWSESEVISVDQVLNNQLVPNLDKPFVSITHNCLDGNFAYPAWDSLGETLVNLGENSTGSPINRKTGSAAHFSSTGLGNIYEHEALADALLEAFFDQGLTTFGDAINYAKTKYLQEIRTNSNLSNAQIYNYNLLGDPGMQVFLAEMTTVKGEAGDNSYELNSNALFNFEISNLSEFTSSANGELTITLPSDLSFLILGVEYTGPNNGEFNFPSNAELEPNTVSTTSEGDGTTKITISLKKILADNEVPTGGIPADGSIKITVAAKVTGSSQNSFWTIPYTYSAPGGIDQSKSIVINLGGGRTVFLPMIRK